MTHWKSATRLLTFLTMVAGSVPAVAGDLGPMSRGSVFISVTIPAQVEITLAQADGGASADDRAVCMTPSRQVGSYHVALIGLPDAAGATAYSLGPNIKSASDIARRCGAPGRSGLTSLAELEQLQASFGGSSEYLTLLVIPD